MSDYGGITFDYPWHVKAADDIAGFSITALQQGAGEQFTTNADGHLVILGELTYRPVRFDQDGRVIVCERVT